MIRESCTEDLDKADTRGGGGGGGGTSPLTRLSGALSGWRVFRRKVERGRILAVLWPIWLHSNEVVLE